MSQKKMTNYYFLKCISSVFLCCQAVAALNVSLDVIDQMNDGHILACGTNVTFVCSVIPATSSMDYLIDNTIVATCNFGYCAAQPSKPANALFEYSPSEGIYNLTFIPVSENDGRKEYKCRFGSDIEFITPSVTVFPDESFSVITNSSDSNDINVTVSTCVSASDKVSFTWYIFKAGESRKIYNTSTTTHKNVSACQSTTMCNGEMSTSMVTITNETDIKGELFFFQVEIIYTYSTASEPYILTIDSPTPYRISEKTLVTDGKSTYKDELWIAFGVFHVLYAMQILLCECYFTKELDTQKPGKKSSTCECICFGIMSSFPVIGSLILICLCCMSKKDCQRYTCVKKLVITIIIFLFGPGLAIILYWCNSIDPKSLKGYNLACRILVYGVYGLGTLILCFDWACLIAIIIKLGDLKESELLIMTLVFVILSWLVFTVLHCCRYNDLDGRNSVGHYCKNTKPRYPEDTTDISDGQSRNS